MPKKTDIPDRPIRDTYRAQIPLLAAILSIGEEEIDLQDLAIRAISLCMIVEEELEIIGQGHNPKDI